MRIDATGQVALVHTTGFWPAVISVVTGSYFNHMLVGINEMECMSAELGGVRRRYIDEFPNAVWSRFPETQLAKHKVAAFALLQYGKPYALLDDFFIGIAIVTRRHTPKWLLKRLRNGRRWECAELADVALQHGGVNVFHDHRPFAAVYPGSFERVFRDYGWLPPKGAPPSQRWAQEQPSHRWSLR